ncbi:MULTISPECIES: DUF6680 family protein [Flavobacterium]|nr:DUF6680 family protein [Flavobacterium collinsii]
MVADFLKDYGELISITLIPFILWFIGIKFQDRKSKQDAKLKLFLSLMANRKATPTREWADSLNLIDIIFQDDKKVRNAWLDYFNSLHPKSPHSGKSNAFLLDLLSEIANNLNYKNLKQTEIDRFYSPQHFGNIESTQDILLKEQIRVLMRSKAYGVEMTEDEYQENLDKVFNSPTS